MTRTFDRIRSVIISWIGGLPLPPRAAARVEFWFAVGYWPRLHNPRTFTEKVLHRKFFEHDPRMPNLIDKTKVKDHVAARLGSDWVIPTLYEGSALPPVEERDWPLPFVIKPNHLSGPIIFARRQEDLDWPAIEAKCNEWMSSRPHGAQFFEWGYRHIQPRILVEEYVGQPGQAPIDYKFYAFRGRVEYLHVHTDREAHHKIAFFNTKWERLDIRILGIDTDDRPIPRPRSLNEMIRAAEVLSATWPFVRVDLYEHDGRPKFGELTFYPGAGLSRYRPLAWDFKLGELWQ